MNQRDRDRLVWLSEMDLESAGPVATALRRERIELARRDLEEKFSAWQQKAEAAGQADEARLAAKGYALFHAH